MLCPQRDPLFGQQHSNRALKNSQGNGKGDLNVTDMTMMTMVFTLEVFDAFV